MASRIPTPGEINTMSPENHKVYENRLRRMAERQGLRLEKSRRRDPRAIDYGTYHLIDPQTDSIVAGSVSSGYGLSLDEIEHALSV
jgi:hypothetical protein